MEIQTAQAQKALTLAEASSFLSLKPAKESDVVLTFYWVDNFDVIVEKQAGGGAINTTHLVAFQDFRNLLNCLSTIPMKQYLLNIQERELLKI